MTLPALDLSLYVHGEEAERQDLASQLTRSLQNHGFVKLVGHGIDDARIAELFRWDRKFFSLSQEEKTSVAHKGAATEPQRGYSGSGAENSARLYQKGVLKATMTEELHDCREHFDTGSPTDNRYPTRWPLEATLPGFRTFMEESYLALETTAAQILSAIETGLAVPAGTFTRHITSARNASELRLNHYPPIEVGELRKGTVSRIWPHFDLGVITLLFQDRVSGLEFEDRGAGANGVDDVNRTNGVRGADGAAPRFCPVETSNPSEMVVNVSETLQRWTNGKVPAGLHWVNLPPELGGKEKGVLAERFSIPFFVKADREANVGSLEECVGEGEKKVYEDMTAIEYHLSRIQSAY